jgi:dihydropteroate synthase
MGILNVTPNSFSDGGLYTNVHAALKRTEVMLHEGADIIDIGGESTRPGSETVTETEELKRVLPVIKAIRKAFPKCILSIDTNKAIVAKAAIDEGCTIVNSLGGFSFDKKMAHIVANSGSQCIIYHIKGIPKTMQKGAIAYTNIIQEITQFFREQIGIGTDAGMKHEQFIIDPGIGFGKTVEQNLAIIRHLHAFASLDCPIAIGVSRKSHLGAVLKEQLKLDTLPTVDERLEASLAETAVAIISGATIVRTHDVLQTKKFISVLESIIS